ncbi:MAG: hypothetical protein RMI91_04150 [Gemmatales bacterium]|nr:hypothetical protein [Gemmatales bacterium]MDW7993826.1 hypothetical protein [Gemmatales bacterium]
MTPATKITSEATETVKHQTAARPQTERAGQYLHDRPADAQAGVRPYGWL